MSEFYVQTQNFGENNVKIQKILMSKCRWKSRFISLFNEYKHWMRMVVGDLCEILYGKFFDHNANQCNDFDNILLDTTSNVQYGIRLSSI